MTLLSVYDLLQYLDAVHNGDEHLFDLFTSQLRAIARSDHDFQCLQVLLSCLFVVGQRFCIIMRASC